jgi:hypothetical protein
MTTDRTNVLLVGTQGKRMRADEAAAGSPEV